MATILGKDGQGGRKAWSASVDIFVDLTDTAGQMTVGVGDEGTWLFMPEGDTTGNQRRGGIARIETGELDQSHDGLAEGSFTIKGIDELSAWEVIA